MVFREHDNQYLSVLDDVLTSEGMEDDRDDVMSDDGTDADVNMAGDGDHPELVITRKCDGILDIILVGEVCYFSNSSS